MESSSNDNGPERIWTQAVEDFFSEKVVRWLFFGVAFSTLPIIANFLLTVTQGINPVIPSLLGRGDLLIISAGVAATGVGELQGVTENGMKRIRIAVTAATYLIVCSASLWFASVATSIASKVPVQEDTIAVGSVILFCASVVSGASCVALAGAK